MDHSSIQNSTKGEQIRQESFISFLSIGISAGLIVVFTLATQNWFHQALAPVLAFSTFCAYEKIKPREFSFWNRSKVKIAILGVVAVLMITGVIFSLHSTIYPLVSAILIFNSHHKNFKTLTLDNIKTMEALRKQAVFNQAEFNNTKFKNYSAEEQESSNDIFHIAG